jgi:hypothetical protein
MSPFFVRLESVKVVPFTIFRIDSVTSSQTYIHSYRGEKGCLYLE